MRRMGPRPDDAQLAPPRDEGDGAGWTPLPRQVCRCLCDPRWHGRTEWQLDFGWTDLAAPPGHVAALRLLQVKPSLLQFVEVRDCGQLRFGLDICEGRRGLLASAGDLLQGMAAAHGQRGLYIDGLDLGGAALPVQRLSVRLRVWDDASPAAQVQLLAADAAWLTRSLAVRAAGLPAQRRSIA